MAGERWLCVAVVAVVALGGGAARADIINGDFSSAALDGSAGWEGLASTSDTSLALVDASSGTLHGRASYTYTWDPDQFNGLGNPPGGWKNEEDAKWLFWVIQVVPADGDGLFAPLGTTKIEFDAKIIVSNDLPTGNEAYNAGTGATFQLSYKGNYLPPGGGLLGDTNGQVVVDVVSMSEPGEVLVFNHEDGIVLTLSTDSVLNVSPEHVEGSDSFTITVDAYFDNFKFVPEPMSAGLLLVGAAGIVMRRRRRRA